MSSFAGEYRHSIDDKNRLSIPSKILDKIDKEKDGAGFAITLGLDGCLFLYTSKKWEDMVAKAANLDIQDPKSRRFQRDLLSKVQEIPGLDQQGRILITPGMKKLANLEKKVVIIGIIDRIEIWDEKTWEKYDSNQSA